MRKLTNNVISEEERLLDMAETTWRYGDVNPATLWQWRRDKTLNFPEPKKVRGRNYFSLAELRRFESRFSDRFGARERETVAA